MKRLNALSIALTVAGALAVAVSLIVDLSPLITLTGLLLVVAGGVKVATVSLWRAMFDADQPPSSSPPP